MLGVDLAKSCTAFWWLFSAKYTVSTGTIPVFRTNLAEFRTCSASRFRAIISNFQKEMTMKLALIPMLAAAVVLSACAGEVPASRSISDLTSAASYSAAPAQTQTSKVLMGHYHIADLRINVPESLRVSEANVFLPIADIVWRGEPIGNRHQQVAAIFADALKDASTHLTTGPEVILQIDVTRFHSVTEKTRLSVGGNHAMRFNLTVIDAATGQVLEPARAVVADVRATGGAEALAEEQMGRTQRVVVVERLAQVLRQELSVEVDEEMIMSRGLTDPQALVLPY
jgi:hypothetical protein